MRENVAPDSPQEAVPEFLVGSIFAERGLPVSLPVLCLISPLAAIATKIISIFPCSP